MNLSAINCNAIKKILDKKGRGIAWQAAGLIRLRGTKYLKH